MFSSLNSSVAVRGHRSFVSRDCATQSASVCGARVEEAERPRRANEGEKKRGEGGDSDLPLPTTSRSTACHKRLNQTKAPGHETPQRKHDNHQPAETELRRAAGGRHRASGSAMRNRNCTLHPRSVYHPPVARPTSGKGANKHAPSQRRAAAITNPTQRLLTA